MAGELLAQLGGAALLVEVLQLVQELAGAGLLLGGDLVIRENAVHLVFDGLATLDDLCLLHVSALNRRRSRASAGA